MKYSVFEKSGIKASKLGFGCMRFPTKEGKIDRELAAKMLDEAIASGVNYIDTAVPYHGGESEEFVGEYLKKYPRESYYLATKLPPWDFKKESDSERIFNEQLKRLQTDYFDFYLLHSLNKDYFELFKKLGAIDFCKKMKREGKIKNLGFSFHDGYEVFEEIINYADWDFCQLQINYMDEEEQAGKKGYELAKKLGVPIIVMEPVKGGLLARLPDDVSGILKEVHPDWSAASWALRYVSSKDNVKVVLSGMSDMEQVRDNLATYSEFKELSLKEEDAVHRAANKLKSRVKNGCTGCRYCMPCPSGVDIPEVFRVWNGYGKYENKWTAAWEWKNLGPDNAAKCVECRLCEKKCPQKLKITEDLKRAKAELDKLS